MCVVVVGVVGASGAVRRRYASQSDAPYPQSLEKRTASSRAAHWETRVERMRRCGERTVRRVSSSIWASTSATMTRARAHGGDAKSIPLYGERDAFLVGASEKGRGAYAARDIKKGEVILQNQKPLACHRTLANATTRCGRCLKETRDGAFCDSCASNAKREFADFERKYVDMTALNQYCAYNGGLKFPLLCARIAAMILSGSLKEQTLEWLCHASNVNNQETMPPQWIEESRLLSAAFNGADGGLITPEWYAGVTSRLHLNAFRVEIPPTSSSTTSSDWKSAMAASLDAITTGRGSGSAIYVLPSLLNHSCAPNIDVKWESGDAAVTLRASDDVAPGEELTITYIDANASIDARQRALEPYGFTCACARCVEDRQRST